VAENEKLDEDHELAVKFFHTIRGQYIIGQALARAVDVMEKEPYPEKLFPIGWIATNMTKEMRAHAKRDDGKGDPGSAEDWGSPS
jgi:hypothetical protein